MGKVAVTIQNVPIAMRVRKGTGDDRQNLVFGWANAPFPAPTDEEPVAKFGSGPAAGSLEAELAEVEEAYSRDFPSDHESGTWYRVIATFLDHIIARHEMFSPLPESMTLFSIPYTGGPDAASIVFGEPTEVEVEFVAKAIADQLVLPAFPLPKVDLQGDRVPMDELEKAAYDFVRLSGRADVSHSEETHGVLIESVVVTDEKLEAMGMSETARSEMTKGLWLGFLVDDDTMDRVESGELSMFSIGGGAIRDPD